MSRFALIHPPLLGPTVWQPCADVLRARGHDVVVPDGRAAVAEPDRWWERWTDACAAGPDRPDVLAGHSGSGAVLPLLAARLRPRVVVFVDAIVPAARGETAASEPMRAFVRDLAAGRDRLPVWTDWWPRAELEPLLPDDPGLRRALIEEQPTLASSFYDVAVPVPDGWDADVTIRYLQLSPAYDDDAAEAGARGWPVTVLPGSHLEMLTDPDAVAAALEQARP
jgi:hypothetical protein